MSDEAKAYYDDVAEKTIAYARPSIRSCEVIFPADLAGEDYIKPGPVISYIDRSYIKEVVD
ncbi:hypothetical protein [Laceyella putida]|uniref:Uncharacterized protein n=1 Tax=Laceyella putida TaxID=110101 RepID=A0ABW2REW1_9BACL